MSISIFPKVWISKQFVKNMNATLPTGIEIVEAYPIGFQEPSLSVLLKRFVFQAFVPESLVTEGYTIPYFTHCIDRFKASRCTR